MWPFPRLLLAEAIRESIAEGVANGYEAYVDKKPAGKCDPFVYQGDISSTEIEVSDETFTITGEETEKQLEPPRLTTLSIRRVV